MRERVRVRETEREQNNATVVPDLDTIIACFIHGLFSETEHKRADINTCAQTQTHTHTRKPGHLLMGGSAEGGAARVRSLSSSRNRLACNTEPAETRQMQAKTTGARCCLESEAQTPVMMMMMMMLALPSWAQMHCCQSRSTRLETPRRTKKRLEHKRIKPSLRGCPRGCPRRLVVKVCALDSACMLLQMRPVLLLLEVRLRRVVWLKLLFLLQLLLVLLLLQLLLLLLLLILQLLQLLKLLLMLLMLLLLPPDILSHLSLFQRWKSCFLSP
jgi:hypothetical protein